MLNNSRENGRHFKGDLKQQWGKFTDDDLKQIEGNTRNLSAKFRNGMPGKRSS